MHAGAPGIQYEAIGGETRHLLVGATSVQDKPGRIEPGASPARRRLGLGSRRRRCARRFQLLVGRTVTSASRHRIQRAAGADESEGTHGIPFDAGALILVMPKTLMMMILRHEYSDLQQYFPESFPTWEIDFGDPKRRASLLADGKLWFFKGSMLAHGQGIALVSKKNADKLIPALLRRPPVKVIRPNGSISRLRNDIVAQREVPCALLLEKCHHCRKTVGRCPKSCSACGGVGWSPGRGGHKFIVRSYLLTLGDGRVFVYGDGLIFVHTAPYEIGSLLPAVNISHWSRHSKQHEDPRPTFTMSAAPWLSATRKAMRDVAAKVAALFRNTALEYMHAHSSRLTSDDFQLFGFDMLVTESMQPVILEFNAYPKLSYSNAAQAEFVKAMMTDFACVVGIPGFQRHSGGTDNDKNATFLQVTDCFFESTTNL